jgi:hypothetical protein
MSGVEIKSDQVEITPSRGRLTQLLAGSIDLTMQHQARSHALRRSRAVVSGQSGAGRIWALY